MKKFSFIAIFIVYLNISLFSLGFVTSLQPGVYNHDITVRLYSSNQGTLYYTFENSRDKTLIPYMFPIHLTAMTGERRTFSITVFLLNIKGKQVTDTVSYTIDKTIPLSPEVNLAPGIYNHNIRITFNKSNAEIFYTTSENSLLKFQRWEGLPIPINQSTITRNFVLRAFAVSSSGNKSKEIIKRYTLLPRPPIPHEIPILSPVDGIFLNNQLLYINVDGFKWIRYSLGNSDPAKYGTTYRYPVLFKAKGEYFLHLAGLPLHSTKIIKKTIHFFIRRGELHPNTLESGVYTDPLLIKLKGSELLYQFSDQPDDKVKLKYKKNECLTLLPLEGMVKYIPLRVYSPDSSEQGVYRYFYIFDRRLPGTPIININRKNGARNVKISLEGPQGTRIYYTQDGSTPDTYSLEYRKPFSITLPDNIQTGSRIIKAIGVYKTGMESSAITKLINFDFLSPEAPKIKVSKMSQGNYHIEIANKGDNTFFYTVTYNGTEPENPDKTSFSGIKNMDLYFPFGISGRLSIKGVLMDSAGNFSDITKVSLPFDLVPPPEPAVQFSNGKVLLSGSGIHYYSINTLKFDNNIVQKTDFKEYTEPIPVSIFHNSDTLSVYSVDKSGNRSRTITERIPVKTDGTYLYYRYSGVQNNGSYNTGRIIRFYPTHDTILYYKITDDGSEPDDPQPLNNQLLVSPLKFNIVSNEEKKYTIKILAVNKNFSKPQIEKILSFSIDDKPPQAPVLILPDNRGIYNHSVTLHTNKSSSIRVLVKKNLTEKDAHSLDNYMEKGIPITDTFSLDVDKGEDRTFQISAVAFDEAGNYTFSDKILTVRIDKKEPELPTIMGIKDNEKTNRAVTFSLHSENGDQIYYYISNGINFPNKEEGSLYAKPVKLSALLQKNRNLHIFAWTKDEAGNYSKNYLRKTISICKRNVSVPDPVFSQLNDHSSLVSFPTIPDILIYYKWDNNEYRLYKNAAIIPLPRKGTSRTITYYAVDMYGNRSPLVNHILENKLKKRLILLGVKNNGIYNNSVTIKKRNPNSVVRYELNIQGFPAGNVSYFSPEFTKPLTFNASPGEVLPLHIKVMEYNSVTNLPESDEESYSFIIDKHIPLKPRISGIEDNAFYQNKRIFKLSASEGKIYYAISSGSSEGKEIFIPYTGPVTVDTPEGTITAFHLKIYTINRAGNKSPVQKISFAIDKAIIYLSSKGKDVFDGTRSRPVKTLKRALEKLKTTGRKIIYCTTGQFLIQKGIILNRDISIRGGFGLNNWNTNKGETIFTAGNLSNSQMPLFTVQSGSISLRDISLGNSGVNRPLILQTGGHLSLQHTALIFANGKGLTALMVKGGKVILDNTNFFFGPVEDSNLFSLQDCTFNMKDFTINGTGISKRLTIFTIDKVSSGIFNTVAITPSSGQIVEFFNINSSKIKMENSVVKTGSDYISLSLFSLKKSTININNCSFTGGYDSRVVSFMDLNQSVAAFNSSTIGLGAQSGISLFNTFHSQLNISTSNIGIEKTQDFIYFLRSENSRINVGNTKFTLDSSSDFTFVNASNSGLVFNGNNVIFKSGVAGQIFHLNTMDSIRIMDNTIMQKQMTGNVPFMIHGNNVVTFTHNSFENWKNIVNYNGLSIKTGEDLNTYGGFSTPPTGNKSN